MAVEPNHPAAVLFVNTHVGKRMAEDGGITVRQVHLQASCPASQRYMKSG